MLAIIRTGGKQYRVQAGDVLDVERLEAEPGARVDFEQVLLIDDDKDTLITPVLLRALVRGEVLDQHRDRKILVFKKKRRKQYREDPGAPPVPDPGSRSGHLRGPRRGPGPGVNVPPPPPAPRPEVPAPAPAAPAPKPAKPKKAAPAHAGPKAGKGEQAKAKDAKKKPAAKKPAPAKHAAKSKE